MIAVRQTEDFWAGCAGCKMAGPKRASPPGSRAWRWEIPVTPRASAKASWKCGSITGPGYRVYYINRGAEIVILLCGGDKRTQRQDIKRAQELAERL